MRDRLHFRPTGDEQKDREIMEGIRQELVRQAMANLGTEKMAYTFSLGEPDENGYITIGIKARRRR